MSRRGRAAAFTLLEVLVALAIFALAAVVLSATYVNVLLNYRAAGARLDHEHDRALARAEVMGEPDRPTVEQGGDLALPAGRSGEWKAEIEDTDVTDLFRVKLHVEIREPSGAEADVSDESFMLLRPTWSDPVERGKLQQAAADRLAQRFSP